MRPNLALPERGISIMSDPVFVIGCPRSGTTLLSELLRMTRYGAPFETHFIPKYYKRLSSFGSLGDVANFRRLVAAILKERPVMQMKLELDLDDLFERGVRDYRELVDQLCLMRNRRLGLSAWGDKTPTYILELDIIYSLFPSSKYIYIVRDGRDVALSLMEEAWGRNNVYACAQYWKKCNAANVVLDGLRQRGAIFEVRYEDLIAQPTMMLSRIYRFLEEPYDGGAMADLIGRIRSGNSNKWRQRMTPDEVETFERVASGTLKRFGYEVTHEEGPIGVGKEIFYKCHDSALTALYLLKMNTIDAVRIKYCGKEPFNE
jgi:hypothetical protein